MITLETFLTLIAPNVIVEVNDEHDRSIIRTRADLVERDLLWHSYMGAKVTYSYRVRCTKSISIILKSNSFANGYTGRKQDLMDILRKKGLPPVPALLLKRKPEVTSVVHVLRDATFEAILGVYQTESEAFSAYQRYRETQEEPVCNYISRVKINSEFYLNPIYKLGVDRWETKPLTEYCFAYTNKYGCDTYIKRLYKNDLLALEYVKLLERHGYYDIEVHKNDKT